MSTGWYLLRDVGFFAVGIFLFYAVFVHRGRERPENTSTRKCNNKEPS
jgi:hypothetical protein